MNPLNTSSLSMTTAGAPAASAPIQIARAGSVATAVGNADYFTGSVRIDAPFQRPAPARVGGATVSFAPGARTAWHTHPLGQTLIVTAGVGSVQEWGKPVQEIRPGDIVWIAPGVKHWHGAKADVAMTHIAIAEALDGVPVTWMEQVSEAQYAGDAPFYPIGTPGQPWGNDEKAQWRARQVPQRRYATDVLPVVEQLRADFDVAQYGTLHPGPDAYPLFALRSRSWNPALPTVLVTGGVHGYETSGVQGALQFLASRASDYAGRANLLVAPCVSPWGYERVQRWNADAIDPNRSFVDNSPAPESAALMALVAPLRGGIVMHIDLHETTDSDESEFRPALAARDGKPFEPGLIPDGFYLVDDTENPQPAFQTAVNAAVEQVTHIAPADERNEIIGSPVVAPGVIEYPLKKLGLCASISGARYTTTTEVYPDSPRATPQQCNDAQVAAICAAIDYALANR